MIGIALLAGIPLILAGVIIKNSPNNVAGYDNLAEDKPLKIKKYKGLQSFALYFSGIAIVLGGVFSEIINKPKILEQTIIITAIISIIIFVYAGYQMSNKRKSFFRIDKRRIYILLPLIIFILFIFIYFTKQTKFVVDSNNIVIEGLYGESIPIKKIKDIKLCDKLPNITIRTNGFALGYILKGYFNVKDEGNVKLFIHSSGPLIKINTEHRIFYFNNKDSIKTQNLYKEILLIYEHQ